MAKDKGKQAVDHVETTKAVTMFCALAAPVKAKRGGHTAPATRVRIARQGQAVYLFAQNPQWDALGNPKTVAVGYTDGHLQLQAHKSDMIDGTGKPVPAFKVQANASKPYKACLLFTSKDDISTSKVWQAIDKALPTGVTSVWHDNAITVNDGVAMVALAQLGIAVS